MTLEEKELLNNGLTNTKDGRIQKIKNHGIMNYGFLRNLEEKGAVIRQSVISKKKSQTEEHKGQYYRRKEEATKNSELQMLKDMAQTIVLAIIAAAAIKIFF